MEIEETHSKRPETERQRQKCGLEDKEVIETWRETHKIGEREMEVQSY